MRKFYLSVFVLILAMVSFAQANISIQGAQGNRPLSIANNVAQPRCFYAGRPEQILNMQLGTEEDRNHDLLAIQFTRARTIWFTPANSNTVYFGYAADCFKNGSINCVLHDYLRPNDPSTEVRITGQFSCR